MPVIIAGSQRSGTSLVAHLLSKCGLHLGLERDLILPGQTRGGSYWGHKHFNKVNDAVLNTIAGAWDSPPEPEHTRALLNNEIPQLDELTTQLMESFEGQEPWGWKDPRNCLTIRYWQRFFPEMKVVFCVRNPIDVFISLHRRHGLSSLLSLNLWMRYNKELASAAKSLPTVITHFESYFADPAAEVARVLESLDIKADQGVIREAAGLVKRDMQGNMHSEAHLPEAGVSEDIIKVYKILCDQGGPVFEKVRKQAAPQSQQSAQGGQQQKPSQTGSQAQKSEAAEASPGHQQQGAPEPEKQQDRQTPPPVNPPPAAAAEGQQPSPEQPPEPEPEES